jgi:hypothetical protein
MRVSFVGTALVLAVAAPVWAQTPPVLGPKTIMPAHVMCTDVHVPALPDRRLQIKGPHHSEIRSIIGEGETVVIGRVAEDGMAVGQRYLVRRIPFGSPSEVPEGGVLPVQTKGWLTVTAVDEVNVLARIDHSCDSIEPTDFLEPYVEPALPTASVSNAPPDFAERLEILTGVDRRAVFGGGDTFSIARGSEHGVVVGGRYAIYRDRKNGRPLTHIGEAVVADVTLTTAKLLLLSTSSDVNTTDIAVPRR